MFFFDIVDAVCDFAVRLVAGPCYTFRKILKDNSTDS